MMDRISYGGRRAGKTRAFIESVPDSVRVLVLCLTAARAKEIGQALWRAKKPRVRVEVLPDIKRAGP